MPIKIPPTIALPQDTGYISQEKGSIVHTNVVKETNCYLPCSLISAPNDVVYIKGIIRFVFLKHILDVRVSENNSETLNKVLSNPVIQTTN